MPGAEIPPQPGCRSSEVAQCCAWVFVRVELELAELGPDGEECHLGGIDPRDTIPFLQLGDRALQLFGQPPVASSCQLPGSDDFRYLFLGQQHRGVEAGLAEGVEGEFFFAREQPPGDFRPGIVLLGHHIGGEIAGPGVVSNGRGEGGLVTVLQKSAGGIEELGQLSEGVVAAPLGVGVAAVDGFAPVEPGSSSGDGRVVDVENIPFTVGVYDVEHRDGERLDGFPELLERSSPAHCVPLGDLPALDEPGEPEADGLSLVSSDDGPMMGFAELVELLPDALRTENFECLAPLFSPAVFFAPAVGQWILGVVEGFYVEIGNIGIIDRVAPAELLIVSKGRYKRAEEGRP